MPGTISRAVTCLWIAAGLAALLTTLQIVGVMATESVTLTAITGVLTVTLLALVAWKIGEARAWARWLFVLLYALGAGVSVAGALAMPKFFLALPPVSQGSIVLQFVLQTAALVLLFTKPSRDWFRATAAPD
ncbi:MAG TPA: hypothetical protein VD965_06370 [Burkholderiales bacterium]|nr:hypothetical protein [Burkholderiales bacterium]